MAVCMYEGFQLMQHHAYGVIMKPSGQENATVVIQARGSRQHELRQPVHARSIFIHSVKKTH